MPFDLNNRANRRLPLAEINLSLPAAMACCAASVAAPVVASTVAHSDVGFRSAANRSTASACGCASTAQPAQSCECESRASRTELVKVTPAMFLKETLTIGRQLALMFFGFAFIGYLLNGLIPAEWVSTLFGGDNHFSILLSATLGAPLYVNTEASMPLVRALIDNGMSQGAALAFLITGAGTSVGALTGALTIARWRVIALVIATLWVGAVVIGSVYDLLLSTRLL
jgi:uncharacterized membrane protein YraQ (UPF0718 family)